MARHLLWFDRISTAIGKACAWLVVILVVTTFYDVVARYLFRSPTGWAYDVSYYLYAAIFMFGGAYALARNQHVRGDFFYRNWPVRTQAAIELLLMVLFFFPGIIALVSSGYQFFELSFSQGERTQTSLIQLPLYPLKAVIPIAGLLMLFQGVAETIRCVLALRDGIWPQRLSDVEETETRLAREAQL
ncbi:MAG TPA: TRAP transporter small permease subunit [Candidatus Limnocylindria bacterium]|nr:TRAP transporter small permease subunit [Candidatus Limnocylindria bacterium]